MRLLLVAEIFAVDPLDEGIVIGRGARLCRPHSVECFLRLLGSMASHGTVGGLFLHRLPAEQAIRALRKGGFTDDEISLAMRGHSEQGKLVEETGMRQLTERVTRGALQGSLLGGLVGLLIGIGALAIPGIGPVVIGGALDSVIGFVGGAAVAGASLGAAAGGLWGALVNLGGSENAPRRFDVGLRSGRALVVVHAGPRAPEALAILKQNGADTDAGSTEMPSSTGR